MGDVFPVERDSVSLSRTPAPVRPAQRFWQKYFAFYDTLNASIPYQRMLERAVELLQVRKGEHVLDAGTGTGNVAVLLAAREARVTGIDFCEAGLDACRAKVPQADFRFGDLTQPLEFGTATFDKVVCCCVLHLLPRDGQQNAAREFFRVLKPGGRAAVTVFASGFRSLAVYAETIREQRRATNLWTAIRFTLKYSINTARILYYVRRIKKTEQSGAYNFLDEEQLRTVFATAGFEVERVERVFAGQCLNLLGRKPGLVA
jgi:ubiquinone/menaquinone biosynthesis C-methylase UbiE